MTKVVRRRVRPSADAIHKEDLVYDPPRAGQVTPAPPSEAARDWTPLDLYNKSAEYRRLLFLEAVGRAVLELDSASPRNGSKS